MEQLLKGLSRIRKGLVWNALTGAFIFANVAVYYLAYSPEYSLPELAPFLSLICATYLWLMFSLLMAIIYQYSGAVALLRSSRTEDPPHGKVLLASAVLIIADPFLNILSAAGMYAAPKGFATGRVLRLWWVALPLYVVGQTGSVAMVVLLPGTPGAHDAATWTFIAVNAAFVLLNCLAYWMLWVVYRGVERGLEAQA